MIKYHTMVSLSSGTYFVMYILTLDKENFRLEKDRLNEIFSELRKRPESVPDTSGGTIVAVSDLSEDDRKRYVKGKQILCQRI